MLFRKQQSGIENDNAYLDKIEDLVREVVTQNEGAFYRIESVMEAQMRAGGEYTLVPVIRIISAFEDSVAHIAGILRNEFDIVVVNEGVKSKSWSDSFSSKNLHYIAALKPNRAGLTEYKSWANTRFEIHVSSMLQDVWVGMARELNFDGGNIPDDVKRDFFRVGAFLEMADIEFLKIKKTVGKWEGSSEPAPVVYQHPVYEQPVQHQQPVQEQPVQEQPVYTPPVYTPEPVAYTPAPEPVAYMPEPEPIPEPVAAVEPEPVVYHQPEISMPDPMMQDMQSTHIDHMDSIDMNLDHGQNLAMNVGNVDNTNGLGRDHVAEMMNMSGYALPEEITPEPVAAPAPQEAPGAVALNIDNVQNFNMNVNGMIERTTEIIREVPAGGVAAAAAAASIVPPAAEEKPKESLPVDENAQMTDASLKEFVMNSKLLKEVDLQIAERAGARLNEDIDIEGDVERLRFLKVFTLKQLHERIADNKEEIVAFAEKWIGKDNGGTFDSGICLFYLEYLLVGKKNDPAFAVEYVLKFISDNDYSARYIIPTYNSIRTTSEPSNFSHLTLK